MTSLEFDDFLSTPNSLHIFDAKDFFADTSNQHKTRSSPVRGNLIDSPVYSPKDNFLGRDFLHSIIPEDLEDSVFGCSVEHSPSFSRTTDSPSTCFCGERHHDFDNNSSEFVVRSISGWYLQWLEPGVNSNVCVHGIDPHQRVHWSSSQIVKRLSQNHVVSATGTHYHLLGSLHMPSMSSSHTFHSSVITQFRLGFPENWKQVLLEWVGFCHTLLEAFPDHSDPDEPGFQLSASRSYFYTDSSDQDHFDYYPRSGLSDDPVHLSSSRAEHAPGRSSKRHYRTAADHTSSRGSSSHHSSKSRSSRSTSSSDHHHHRSNGAYSSQRDDANDDGRDPSRHALPRGADSKSSRHRHSDHRTLSHLVFSAAEQKASKYLGKHFEMHADEIAARLQNGASDPMLYSHRGSPKRSRFPNPVGDAESSKKARRARVNTAGACCAPNCTRTANQRCSLLFCRQCCLLSGNRCEEHSANPSSKELFHDSKPPLPSVIHRQACQGTTSCTNKLNKKCPHKLCRDCCSNRQVPCRVHSSSS